ncbi:MAG: agmatinase [Thaumarchaeota archaeon]|nr:MAG: agmatinase [Nitrososphaerota archaeon]TLX83649.1 MAG: agmatinase [Nitrososphaerota archaeon]
MQVKICWANTDNFDESDIVIVGIPDESKSNALRKGSSEAPDKIREISSIRDTYTRNGQISLGLPISGIKKKIFDYGNVKKTDVGNVINKIISGSKIPISLGGDHSISLEIIKSISKKLGPVSLVYFDAHPDFIGSTRNYYGSVFYDSLPHIDTKSSLQIGIRTPEQEEIENMKKYSITVITPLDIVKNGILKTEKMMLDKIGKKVYVSFDMDAIDPAYAPGVSVPVPMGLRNTEVIYLLKSLAKRIIGIDIMEVCPSYDIRDRTSHLASRMIAEIISSS